MTSTLQVYAILANLIHFDKQITDINTDIDLLHDNVRFRCLADPTCVFYFAPYLIDNIQWIDRIVLAKVSTAKLSYWAMLSNGSPMQSDI